MNDDETKRCASCEQDLPLTAFYRSRRDGFQSRCTDCKRAYNDANRDQINARHRAYLRRTGRRGAPGNRVTAALLATSDLVSIKQLRRYGLRQADYEALLVWQAGCCAICHTHGARRLVIDHDHETGEIRGLLCDGCNTGLGLLGDTAPRVEAALAYLSKSAGLMDGGFAARVGGRW